MSRNSSRLLQSVVWFLLLIFLAWPIAGFCAAWWVFFIPFEGFSDIFCQITSFLEKIMSWPRDVGRAIIDGSSQFPSPF